MNKGCKVNTTLCKHKIYLVVYKVKCLSPLFIKKPIPSVKKIRNIKNLSRILV
jgi:hypothetical protein